MTKPRIAVIGMGVMGQNHLKALSEIRHLVEIVGFYDVDVEKRQKIAEQYQVKLFRNLDELFEAVDAVTIATPTHSHYQVIKQAIYNKKHVFVEKPITLENWQAENVIQEAEKLGLILQVGHIERFNPAVIIVKELLENTNINVITMQRMNPYDPRISDADVISDLMVHDLDLLRYLLPHETMRIMNATGKNVFSRNNLIDYAMCSLVSDSGILVSCTASRITENRVREMLLHAEGMLIKLDLIEQNIFIHKRADIHLYDQKTSFQRANVIERPNVSKKEPIRLEMEHFIDCIIHDHKPICTGQDGLIAVKKVNEIRELIQSYSLASLAL